MQTAENYSAGIEQVHESGQHTALAAVAVPVLVAALSETVLAAAAHIARFVG